MAEPRLAPCYLGGDYRAEMFDKVEIEADGALYEGVVVRVWPRDAKVSVRFEDHRAIFRTTGNPRRRTVLLRATDVTLIARDG